ncbi:GNAT family N-acetyltransferase [Fundidesulfovibrio terrae]|uniref:GNAT family N-acetyltransferase n=1 Tax=Fundidesulfovibrio terrae TaxID=2922866 RepID=UPI001FAF25A6|nr:GNAT family N-acetyltransferase [Fundidesulfovibrio terrae]
MREHDYLVRKASLDDIASLSDLFLEFIGRPSNADSLKKRIEIISNNPLYFVAVACDSHKVIGTAMGIVCHDLVGNCDPFLLIENVVVLPSHRGKNAGKLLVNSLEEFGRLNNCNYAVLVSDEKRTRAHGFYQSLGYAGHAGFKKRLKSQTEG